MNLEAAKNTFKNILKALDGPERAEFLSWCDTNFTGSEAQSKFSAYFDLRTIAEDIKTMLPVEAILPSETVDSPKIKGVCDNSEPVLHVDSFLYEDEHIDALVEEGKLHRNFCRNCKSFNVSPINFISHSASISRIEYIFKTMLPDLSGKVFLDVGSRLGAMLYGAYFCSASSKIIGVEMNQDLCNLQNHIVNKYNLRDRVEIICSDICHVPGVVQSANVITFNNVFQYFMPIEIQQRIWLWLRSTITTPGTVIITIPSIEETLRNLNVEMDVSTWLRRHISDDSSENFDDPELIEETCCYVVL